MMEENFESANIHLKWLDNIYDELSIIQDMERVATEGCKNLVEYFNIPFSERGIIIPDAQYKNLRFLILEMDILLTNLRPIIPEKIEEYNKRLKPILESINNRNLFIGSRKNNGKIVELFVKEFFYKSLNYVLRIKSDIIYDIKQILYLDSNKKAKW